MKHEIIYTEDYALIVSDEQIKDVRPFIGRYHLEKGYIINQFPTYLTDLSECKLIIAHRPLKDAPILEGVDLLPEFNKEDDVEEVASTLFRNKMDNLEEIHSDYILGFIDGYNKAKETYKYTEEDILDAWELGASEGLPLTREKKDKLIKSLQQPKRPKYFECEMEDTFLLKNRKGGNTIMAKPKTITNSERQTELVGEYTY